MKRLFSLLLAMALLAGCAPALAQDALDTYTYWEPNWPIVKEGETLNVSVATSVNSSYYKSPDETWFWRWSEEATGIDFDVRQITAEAMDEQRNLMFASDNLPDVLIGLELTAGDLMRYGATEKQLLDLTPYINEETMPYLSLWFEKYPMMRTLATSPDGAIYSLPFTRLKTDYEGSHETAFYNMEWLKEVVDGLPEIPSTREEYDAWVEATQDVLPRTLDEFTELLYAFKENHPDSTPLAGVASDSDKRKNPMSFLLNAFGYLTTSDNVYGHDVALKDGQVVIPATDDDFFEFLKLANQYYTDGIICKDFFVADDLVYNAQITDNQSGVEVKNFVYAFLPEAEDYHKWDAMYPLTSDFNPEAAVLEADLYKVGGCALSADAQNVEEILNWLDFFYSDLGIFYLWCGPINGSPDTLGMVEGFYYDVEKGSKVFPDVLNGDYENNLAYVYTIGFGQTASFGNRSHSITDESYATMWQALQHLQGVADDQINRVTLSYDHGDNYSRICSATRVIPYVKTGFPSIVYYDDATQSTIDEISLLLDDYIESEVAKFITGATPLTEENFQAFVDECNAYGAADLQAIYAEAYEDYLSNLQD